MTEAFRPTTRARALFIPPFVASVLIAASLSAGYAMRRAAFRDWSSHMHADCSRLASGLAGRFGILEQKLRSLVILDGAAERLTKPMLLDALEKMEFNATSVPLGDVVLLRDGKSVLTTAIAGPLADGADPLAIPEIARAYAMSRDQPGTVVMSRSFLLGNSRSIALVAYMPRTGASAGAFISLVRAEDFFGGFRSVEMPKGFALTLHESGARRDSALLRTDPDGPVLERVLEVREIGLSGWEFDWSATSGYLEGPSTGMGLLIAIGGSIAALLVATLMRVLLLRNLEVSRLVEEKTAELNNALDALRGNEAALVQAKEKAEAANRAKSSFLSSMSHELRTPLNAILGFSQIMRGEEDCTEKQQRNLDIILRSGNHLLNLINDVLSLAKVESRKAELEPVDFDLGNLVNEIVDMLRLRAEDKGLKLFVDQSSSFPRFVRTDVVKLRQVLINLVGNAVKFTETGHVSVRLFTHSETQPGDKIRLVFEITDTGAGMDADDLERIFRPFEQAKHRLAVEGTGLGLALAKSYIGLMGGGVTVTSAPGRGSTFRFDIVCDPAENASSLDAPAKPGKITGAEGAADCRILIVDDQPENRLLLKKILGKSGFLLREAENGAVALEAVAEWSPHLILLDRRMPVMNGDEVARRLRAGPDGKSHRIVAVTAQAYNEEMREMLDAGCDDFVKKPFKAEEIYAAIEKLTAVRFVRETPAEPSPAATTQPAGNLRSGLAALVPEDLAEMRKALESADPEAALAIAGKYPGLPDAIRQHLDGFRYDLVNEALPPA